MNGWIDSDSDVIGKDVVLLISPPDERLVCLDDRLMVRVCCKSRISAYLDMLDGQSDTLLLLTIILQPLLQENHAIAKMTARCAQYMSALKIVCKRKTSRQLRKNRHITILSLFGGEIIFEVFQPT